jgi:SAM-dependent methyltransferase
MTAPSHYEFKRGKYSSHARILERIPVVSEPIRVLDVGGGEGYLASALQDRGYQVTCLAAPGTVNPDIPSAVKVIESDLDFDFPGLNAGFRYIVCGDVIEHVRDPSRLLRWLRGLMEPDGEIVASLPNSGHWHFRLNVLLGRFPAEDRGLFDRTHLHFYTWKGWRSLFAENRFELESVEPTPIPFGLAFGLSDSHPLVRLCEAVNYHLARLWKSLLAYQFVVTAGRVNSLARVNSIRQPARRKRRTRGFARKI